MGAVITISTLMSQQVVYGNGATTVWALSFTPDSAIDIAVIYTDITGQPTTLSPSQYLVALNPIGLGQLWSTGFTLTYPLSGSPIAAGTSLTIQRILPLTQETDISNQGDFSPVVVEQALDTLCMQIQQLAMRGGQIRGTWLTATLYNFGDIVVDGVNGNNTGNLYVCAIANTSGTWDTDLSNGDWSLALNVQAIVNSLPQIANNQVFANISGITATPTGVGVSALIDSAIGNTQGSILYRSGSLWSALSPGINGQVLATQGVAADPHWVATSGTGTITGVTAGSGLAGGGTSGTVTLSLSNIANNSILANTSGVTGPAGAVTLSALLDSIVGSAQGSILYRAGTNWTSLPPGTSGQILSSGGPAANPFWSSNLVATTTAVTQVPSDNTSKLATTSFVQTAISSGSLPTALGVGSYIMASNGSSVSAGMTVAGSSLTIYGGNSFGVGNYFNPTSDTVTGTWKAMQSGGVGGSSSSNIGLWLRIS